MTRISLRYKLILSYLVLAIFTSGLIYALIRVSSQHRLEELIHDHHLAEIQQEVKNWYVAEGTWKGFQQYFFKLHPPKAKNEAAGIEDDKNQTLRSHGIVTAQNRVLIRFLDFQTRDIVSDAYLVDAIPVIVDGEVVARVVPGETIGLTLDSEEAIFLKRTDRALQIAVLASLGLALVLALAFSRLITRPISALTKAATRMAAGDLRQEVKAQGTDEVAQLVNTFNQMSSDIARLNDRRVQFTADISHDLGTPLQVISGYVETMLSGDLDITPQRLNIIEKEVELMRRLVRDLSLLASVDDHSLSLIMQPVKVSRLISNSLETFRNQAEQKQIDLRFLDNLPKALEHRLDPDRMEQVLGNILSNAIRYTPEQGVIAFYADVIDKRLIIRLTDSGVGVNQEQLAKLFDRSFRADPARDSKGGNKGLGLAIAKALIEAQGGEITASSDGAGKGLSIILSFNLD